MSMVYQFVLSTIKLLHLELLAGFYVVLFPNLHRQDNLSFA